MSRRKLNIVYILPSRYDDEGYVHRYVRGVLPSNTLSCLKELTLDVVRRGELGEDIEVSVEILDDSVQRINVGQIIRRGQRGGARLLVGFVGVQSNQFPRAADLALQFRAAEVPVMIGGFHVSGVLALFHEPSDELKALLERGVTLVRGEAEVPGVLAGILRDALEGRLQPIYNITAAPDISASAVPQPDPSYLKRFVFNYMGTIDASRGCPFNCSFCTIINVQGRKMRHRSADAILQTIEQNYDRGIHCYFFTDDNFSRNPVWSEIFAGLARMRAAGKNIRFMMQVDTLAVRIKGFVDAAREAGCYLVFIGMESINPDNIAASGKKQNKVEDFPAMVEQWHKAGILVETGYIIGFPHDTPESVRRDLATLKDTIRVDEAAFFMLTPLPGSQDHLRMVKEGIEIDGDLNKYDSFHETFTHPKIKPGEWQALYEEAWETFYNKEHIVNMLLRTSADNYWSLFWLSLWNRYSTLIKTHPMVAGFVRLKDRRQRRSTFPRESMARYAWRRTKDFWQLGKVFGQLFFEFQEIWLLTRRQDDPRWRTLADLRERWAQARQHVADIDLSITREKAAGEIRDILQACSQHLDDLTRSGKRLPGRLRHGLSEQAREIEQYLHSLNLEVPGWNEVVQAEQFISENLLRRYENLAIRYVARRRRFNEYRREMIARFKAGRVFTPKLAIMPNFVIFESLLALRFGIAFFSRL